MLDHARWQAVPATALHPWRLPRPPVVRGRTRRHRNRRHGGRLSRRPNVRPVQVRPRDGCAVSSTGTWWKPLFAGYGGSPELDTLRRRMLTATEDNYACLGLEKQKERLLHAQDWQDLFALRSRALSSN